MGVSFKISRTGARFRPKLLQIECSGNENDGAVAGSQQIAAEGDYTRIGGNVANHASVMINSGLHSGLKDLEASFSLNLFPDGFSVGKITEVFDDLPKQLHPYDRASKTLFSAIEYGWLPGDILDDLPCKYINGAVLCEVRDYRKCLFSKVDNASAEKSPMVHKVMLKMCMENVVKDLLSLSDDSWTYGDLLEAESCILKALQPDLHLNPRLALDRNPITKKLDFGITWSWQKRELNPPPAAKLDFSSVQSSNSELFQTYQDSGVSSLEHLHSSTTSLCKPLTSESPNQISDSYNQPVLNLLTNPTNLVSGPKQVAANSSDPRKVSFSGVGGSTGCIIQAIEGHILKKPKTEPVEFSLDSESQWRNDILLQRAMVDKFQYERSLVKTGLHLSQGNDQQVLKVLPMPLTLKQEPVETSNLGSSEVGKRNDKDTMTCQRSNQSNHQQQCMQYIPPSLKANIATNAPGDQLDQYLGEKSRKNSGAQKRKPLVNPQVSIGARNGSSSYCHNEAMQSKESRPGKRAKTKYNPKGCEVVDSLNCTSNYDASNVISPPFYNLPFRQPSTVKCDPDSLFERFMKVKMMTQRHGLNKRKCKLDRHLQKKAVFNKTPPMGLHLSNCDDNQNLEQTRTFTFVRPGDSEIDYETRVKLILSERLNERMEETCVLYYQPTKETESIDVPITPSFPSTLFTNLFAAQFKSLMVREGYSLESDQIKPTLLNSDDNSSNHQQSVPSSDSQVKIVGQYMSMLASGPSQDICSGRFALPPGSTMQLSDNPTIKSQLDIAGKGCSKKSPNPLSKSQVDIAAKGKSLQLCNPLSKSKLGNISSKGSSVQSRDHLSNLGIDLAGKGYSNPLSESKLDIAVKGNPMQSYHPLSEQQVEIIAKGNHPMQSYNPRSTSQLDISNKGNHMQSSWQQILNRHAHLQFQMQQRRRQRQLDQIMQGKAEVGRLGLAGCGPGRMQFSGGIRGVGNINLASLSSLMGTGGFMPSSMGGQFPWMGNLGQLNNLSDNLLSSNESTQFSSCAASSDYPTDVLPNPKVEGQVSSLPSGVRVPTNAGTVPMQTPITLDMASNLNHQQFCRLPQEQNLQKQVGEAMSSLFQSPKAGFLLEHVVSSPPSQGSLQQLERHSETCVRGVAVGCPESQELSSLTHGSVGSSSNASSNKLLGFQKDNSAATGGSKI